MHASSLENLQRCFDLVFDGGADLDGRAPASITVLDLGAGEAGDGHRRIFDHPSFRFVGADLRPGPGVDVVLDDPVRLPFDDGAVGVVLASHVLQRRERFWDAFQEMARVLAPEGLIILIAPSAGPIYGDPVDCYRFYPDAYIALAKLAGCHLLECRVDERGPWYDLVGIFSKQARGLPARPRRTLLPAAHHLGGDPALEVTGGRAPYRDVLGAVHEHLGPELYLEIGVRQGDSLALARCPAIAVDPFPEIAAVPEQAQVFAEASDDFFEHDAPEALVSPPDLVFIDGMHLFEYALRDFMNVERWAHPATAVVIDDVLPNHPAQAERDRRTLVWTGDVWKLADCLRTHRPDLRLVPIDAEPTGLLLVVGLDPDDRTLWADYDGIVDRYRGAAHATPPPEVLDRTGAVAPDDPSIAALLGALRQARADRPGVGEVRRLLDAVVPPFGG